MSVLKFTALGAPISLNHAWQIVKIRKRPTIMLTKHARAFKAGIAALAHVALGRTPRIDAPIVVALDLYFPNRRGDVDGPVKLILDALQGYKQNKRAPALGGCIVNDRQVKEYAVRRFVDRDHPRTEITVTVLATAGGAV